MSVDTTLYQVTPEELELFSRDKSAFWAFADEVGNSYFSPTAPSVDQRMLFLGEFSKSLLADTREDASCASMALAFAGHHFKIDDTDWVFYHTADEVKKLAEDLAAFPLADLFARLDGIMQDVRIAAAGFLDSDEAIRDHQIKEWNKLVDFYRRAADGNKAVLMRIG